MPTGIYIRTEEHCKKLSLAHLGKKHTREQKKKIGLANKGREVSEETREKISKGNKGEKLPPISEETRRKRSLAKLGNKHPNWKGGITPINKRIRISMKYKTWRTSVFVRDKYTCVWCGARSAKNKTVILEADHIKPFAYYPEFRFTTNNGRTLCKNCHRKTDTFAGKAKREYIYAT